MQKELRDWFFKRHPKIKALIDFSCKILPDFIIEEVLLALQKTRGECSLNATNGGDVNAREGPLDHVSGPKADILRHYKLAVELSRQKITNLLEAYLPSYLKDQKVLAVSSGLFLEALRPELYRRCTLFIHK